MWLCSKKLQGTIKEAAEKLPYRRQRTSARVSIWGKNCHRRLHSSPRWVLLLFPHLRFPLNPPQASGSRCVVQKTVMTGNVLGWIHSVLHLSDLSPWCFPGSDFLIPGCIFLSLRLEDNTLHFENVKRNFKKL